MAHEDEEEEEMDEAHDKDEDEEEMDEGYSIPKTNWND